MRADSPPGSELERLVARYGRLIRNVVARVAGPRAALLGDEVEQRVAVALWRQLEREQTIRHPASYIYRMAVRETVRVLREQIRHESPADPLAIETAPRSSLDLIAAQEQAAALDKSLGALGPDRRRAVRAHLAGFTVAEIMGMYGWSYQTARNLIARGMSDLRKLLRAQGIDG